METPEFNDKLRKWLKYVGESSGNVLTEEDTDFYVFIFTKFFTDIKIDDNSCQIYSDLSDFVEDGFEVPDDLDNCRIDDNTLHIIDSYGDVWAMLNYRFNENQLVLWCEIDYYIEVFLELDTSRTEEEDSQYVESFKALFEGIDHYVNTFVKTDS